MFRGESLGARRRESERIFQQENYAYSRRNIPERRFWKGLRYTRVKSAYAISRFPSGTTRSMTNVPFSNRARAILTRIRFPFFSVKKCTPGGSAYAR